MTGHGPVRAERRNPVAQLIKQAKSPSWVGRKQEKLQDAGQKKTVCAHTGCTHARASSHGARAERPKP